MLSFLHLIRNRVLIYFALLSSIKLMVPPMYIIWLGDNCGRKICCGFGCNCYCWCWKVNTSYKWILHLKTVIDLNKLDKWYIDARWAFKFIAFPPSFISEIMNGICGKDWFNTMSPCTETLGVCYFHRQLCGNCQWYRSDLL